ncbi:MAG TPA: DUF2089 domain-containing protein [Thermoflexia bacterium]|nr:MAG: hypothetical protein DRI80_05560 [Chloroflexota bacterium]HEY66858.1 DUF2089 domain-containing protein [Thermoflexia bacterium]
MRTTSEERLKILQMLEEGKITAEEAASLLRAMGRGQHATFEGPRLGEESRRLRIQVTDLGTGRRKVNINLPWKLVSVGAKIGARFAPEEIDLEEVMEAIRAGTVGKIMDIEDMEDNERVEIFIE